MSGIMQQLHSTQESGMTHDDGLTSNKPDNDPAYRIKPQDENVFTLAALSKSVPEEQIDDASALRINPDKQTMFTAGPDPLRRRRIYIAGSFVVLGAAVIVIYVFYFLHVASSTTGVTSSGELTGPAVDDITRQISGVADTRNDETTGSAPAAISAAARQGYAENSINGNGTPKQTDAEIAGQHKEEPSSTAEEIVPAELPTVTISDLSSPITTAAHAFAPDTDAMVVMDYAAGSATEEIRIIRKRAPDRIGALINAAYAAYVAGNYSDARQAYLGVLKDMPDHRDALLGLAAIARRTGDPDEAGRIWLQVLADYPDDPVATAALVDLMAAQDYTGSTRAIGKLLRDHPHAAFLYFSLGNLHAAASRWPEARQAFTEACRLEGDNPDYAYNLAVSLEHEGNRGAALDYYQAVLELAHDRPVHFDSAEVRARITVLSEISHGR